MNKTLALLLLLPTSLLGQSHSTKKAVAPHASASHAQTANRPQFRGEGLTPTPPMGWNSWDAWNFTINQDQFEQSARWMRKHLRPYGYRYMVIDEGWYLRNPASGGKPAWQFTIDKYGQYTPATNRFPTAANGAGFRPLSNYIHSLGLKFGFHIVRGIPRQAAEQNLPIAGSKFHLQDAVDHSKNADCPWNTDNFGVKDNAAGQAYYNSLAKLYARWGVDFLKVDCISSHPYRGTEIHMIHRALRRYAPHIVLSLSPGPTPLQEHNDVRRNAQMWRMSDDVWDHWHQDPRQWWSQGIRAQFFTAAEWMPYQGHGHWADADMLPIGQLRPFPGWGKPRATRLTHAEQRSMMTLWSMARSPLIIGANLLQLDSWTTKLLTNREVLAIDQHSFDNHAVITTYRTAVWTARPQRGGGYYLSVSNLSDQPQSISYQWRQLDLPGGAYRVRDLWAHKNIGRETSLKVDLQPHASVLYRLTR